MRNSVLGVEGETVTLANSCVCCTIRDDLVGACLGLLQRDEPPEHLLIELSGVSDPFPVLNTFLETDLGTIYSLSTVLSIVDAEQLPGLQHEMGDLVRAQIQAADIVVLNKVDLVSSGALMDVRKRVHRMTPGSRSHRAPGAVEFRWRSFLRMEIPCHTRRATYDSDDHDEHRHGHRFLHVGLDLRPSPVTAQAEIGFGGIAGHSLSLQGHRLSGRTANFSLRAADGTAND